MAQSLDPACEQVECDDLVKDELVEVRVSGPGTLGVLDVDVLAVGRELQLAQRGAESAAAQVRDEAPDVLQADPWPVAELDHDQQLDEVLEGVQPDGVARA